MPPQAAAERSETSSGSNSPVTPWQALLANLAEEMPFVVGEISLNRPGWQTTEFYFVALGYLLTILLGAFGKIPPSGDVALLIIQGALYQAMRNVRKTDHQTALANFLGTITEAGRPSPAMRIAQLSSPQHAAAQALSAAEPQTSVPSGAPAVVSGGAVAKVATILLACAFLFTGCATDTGNASKDRRGRVTNQILANLATNAGKIAMGALESAVISASSGDTHGKDLQQAAAAGAWKSVGSIDVAADIASTVNAWNGGSAPQVASASAAVFAIAAPQTPQDKAAVVNLIATKINSAASAVTSPPGASLDHGTYRRPAFRTRPFQSLDLNVFDVILA